MVGRFSSVFMALALLITASCSSSSEGGAETSAAAEASPITGGTVQVAMIDFAFNPNAFTVKAGSTITFVFTNTGRVKHEAVIGDIEFQDEHEAEMAEGGGMMEEGSSNEPEVVADPGETGELTFTFDTPGTLYIGCHYPEHWDQGMKATVTVVE